MDDSPRPIAGRTSLDRGPVLPYRDLAAPATIPSTGPGQGPELHAPTPSADGRTR